MEHKEPNIVLDKTLLEDLLKQELHCRKCSKKGLVCMVVKGSHNECSVSVTCPSPDCFYHYELKLETSHRHPCQNQSFRHFDTAVSCRTSCVPISASVSGVWLAVRTTFLWEDTTSTNCRISLRTHPSRGGQRDRNK